MDQSDQTLLFTVSNHHTKEAGQPPSLNGDEPDCYPSYFENRYGEQSIFIHKRATGEAVVYCGDAGWNAYHVVNGQVEGLVLAPEEGIWVQACLKACGLSK